MVLKQKRDFVIFNEIKDYDDDLKIILNKNN